MTQETKLGYGLVAAGAALVAIACFLPWLTATAPFVGTISRNGMDGGGDGTWILIVAIAIGALAVWGFTTGRLLRATAGWIFIALGIGGLALAWIEKSSVDDRISQVTATSSSMISASTGAGIWALFVGAAAIGVGGFILMRDAKGLPPIPV